MPWKNVENRADRASLARDAGLGQVSLVSVLAGTLVAYGAFAVLLAITAAVAESVGVDTDLTTNEWERLGTVGGVIIAGVLFFCYLLGGYVAGRMARRAGATNGFLVFVLGVLVAVGVTGLVNVFTDGDEILANLRNVGVPTSSDEWGDIGTVAGIGSVVTMLVGSVLGGSLGERWHGKLVTRALDPDIGPAAEAREEEIEARERAVEEDRPTAPSTRTAAVVPGRPGDRDRDDLDRDDDRDRPSTGLLAGIRGRRRDRADRDVEPREEPAVEERTDEDTVVPAGGPVGRSEQEAAWEAEWEARARARDERAQAAEAARRTARPTGGTRRRT
jgi:hypothetical protein